MSNKRKSREIADDIRNTALYSIISDAPSQYIHHGKVSWGGIFDMPPIILKPAEKANSFRAGLWRAIEFLENNHGTTGKHIFDELGRMSMNMDMDIHDHITDADWHQGFLTDYNDKGDINNFRAEGDPRAYCTVSSVYWRVLAETLKDISSGGPTSTLQEGSKEALRQSYNIVEDMAMMHDKEAAAAAGDEKRKLRHETVAKSLREEIKPKLLELAKTLELPINTQRGKALITS